MVLRVQTSYLGGMCPAQPNPSYPRCEQSPNARLCIHGHCDDRRASVRRGARRRRADEEGARREVLDFERDGGTYSSRRSGRAGAYDTLNPLLTL